MRAIQLIVGDRFTIVGYPERIFYRVGAPLVKIQNEFMVPIHDFGKQPTQASLMYIPPNQEIILVEKKVA